MLELENVKFSYGGEEALKGISLSIKDGEFCAVLGTNGSGKSTLAKLLNGLLVPKSGTVRVYGLSTADETALPQIRRKVGMVFQNPDNQIISASVEDEVAFGAENLGTAPDEIRKRVDEALDAVSMTSQRKSQTSNLSGGEKQRVAIASILAMHPKTIVFDESTSMLDPGGRADFMRLVRKLNTERKITVVLITHHMDEAAHADRVIVMDNGKIAADGTPREIFADAEKICGMGLGVPQITLLAKKLRDAGVALPDGILFENEMADALETALKGAKEPNRT